MNTTKQIGLALFLVIGASGTVFLKSRAGASADAQSEESGGHNMAAMGAGGDERRPVRLDRESARRIGVTFATVESRPLAPVLRTIGRVMYDETGLATLNPKIEGWVERLFVDFTGAPVRRGEPLLEVYSPKLVSAQEELILARRLVDEMDVEGGSSRALQNARELFISARRRLVYWDIPEDEIDRIAETGEVRKALTLRSPADGIVIQKGVVEGDRIMPGMMVYRIADLSTVWIEADVFEKDLALVREQQRATITFDALPGREFRGRVTYVYPTVSMQSRTGSIRLELPNPRLDLKPGMFADIRLDVGSGSNSLVVPRGAVLSTGERSVVFVQSADGTLTPTEIITGRLDGQDIEVLSGLEIGQLVVSSGTFLIDAESNLGSAMSAMEGDGSGMSGMTPDSAMGGIENGASNMGEMTPDTTVGQTHDGHGMDAGSSSTPSHGGH